MTRLESGKIENTNRYLVFKEGRKCMLSLVEGDLSTDINIGIIKTWC